MTIVEMCVHMDCAGCESKIKKALKKLRGVDDVEIDMGMQKVTVMGWAEQKKVLKAVRKTGRRAELWPYPYNPESHAFSRHYYYNSSSSSNNNYNYNYRKHGYSNAEDFGYYRQPIGATVVSDKAISIFSDDNPHACSIM